MHSFKAGFKLLAAKAKYSCTPSLSQVSQVSLPNSHIHDIFCSCFQDNVPWMPCLLLQHLLVPSRYCETHSPKPFAWLCFPSSVPKVRFTCKGPLSKSAAEQHKKFLSSEFGVLFVIKTDCHTSYYLYAASCLEETVWEHFHTEKNFAARFRRKTQIQNLYQSSILLGESLFMLYMPTKENDFTENHQDIPMKQDSSLPK